MARNKQFSNGPNIFDSTRPPSYRAYSYGHGVKGGVGSYTDDNPGLVRYRGCDEAGNPTGASTRTRLGQRNVEEPAGRENLPDTVTGLSAKLPRK